VSGGVEVEPVELMYSLSCPRMVACASFLDPDLHLSHHAHQKELGEGSYIEVTPVPASM